MSRRNTIIKLDINSPDKFLTSCENIVEYNNTLGPASPLADGDMVNMTEFAAKVSAARDKREKAKKLYAEAESLMGESRALLGLGAGQSSTTRGTVYYMACKIKAFFKALYTENPEEINMWGLQVVIKTAKPGGRKKKVSA
ncbi:MAG: hypothetical protein U0T74_09145 [Chitinophagales bacterium]